MSDFLNSVRAKIADIERSAAEKGSISGPQQAALANLRRAEAEALAPKAQVGRAKVPYDNLVLSRALDDPSTSDGQKAWAKRILESGKPLSASDSGFVASMVKKYS